MKAKQFHEMSNDELKVKLKDLKQELFNLRFQHATGQLSNPKSLTVCKKDIARVMTVLRERELGIKRVKA
jgi:large subunit ribosomal protein L29